MKTMKLVAALAAAGMALPAYAASGDEMMLRQLLERMERLEARNAELEREVKTLKATSERIDSSLESEQISEHEPELTTRLKAVESEVAEMKKPVKVIEALEGIKVDAAFTTVAQRPSGLPSGTRHDGGQLGYRADLAVEIPLQPVGNVDHKVFTHFRIGQGLGVNRALGDLGYYANTANSAAFRPSGAEPDESHVILGELWYQAAIPLPFGGFKPNSTQSLELTFGKVDVFGFFDQNEVADDEATQFLNSVFVHNPLLDAGDEVGVDGNGFQPGVIASYVNESNADEPWRISLGVLGSGPEGANYEKSLSSPLLMLQAEKQWQFGGLPGNYRAYLWSRNNVEEFDGSKERHRGFGFSVDQQVGDGVTLFGRYGQMLTGDLPFNRAVALGAEINGTYWGRANDAIGVGASWLKTSDAYRKYGAHYVPEDEFDEGFGFRPSGAEKVAEIYYRYHVSPLFDLSPDFQWIRRGGGNGHAGSTRIIGLRANIAY